MKKWLSISLCLTLLFGGITIPYLSETFKVEAATNIERLGTGGVSNFNFEGYFDKTNLMARNGGTWTPTNSKVFGENRIEFSITKVTYYPSSEVQNELITKLGKDFVDELKGQMKKNIQKKLG